MRRVASAMRAVLRGSRRADHVSRWPAVYEMFGPEKQVVAGGRDIPTQTARHSRKSQLDVDQQIALHVAGATVRHGSPFSALEVPPSSGPLDARFIAKWCEPYYLMDPTRLDADIVRRLRSAWNELDESVVLRLLGDFNWRPRIVGAYFVALKGFRFGDEIGRLLLRSDVCYAGGGYCLALALANDSRGLGYLRQYLDYYLHQPQLWFDQGDAMGAIALLDRLNGTDVLSSYLPAWSAFVGNKPNWNLDKSIDWFRLRYEGLASLRDACRS